MNPVGSGGLTQAAKQLSTEWQEAKSHWFDAKGREFEEKYLVELPHEIARTVTAIDEISAVLKKLRNDCE